MTRELTGREEMIDRLREQDHAIEQRIGTLEHEAQSASTGGIREFRRHRVDQLRRRHRDLKTRVDLLESRHSDGWNGLQDEAEQLWSDLKETAFVAANTFH